jgi:hypothetical protein
MGEAYEDYEQREMRRIERAMNKVEKLMAETKELAVIDVTAYNMLAFDPQEAAEAIRDTVGTIDPRRDLTVLVAPGPKGKSWDLVSATGEVEELKSVTGIIVAKRQTRAYYESAYSPGSNEPPTCIAEPDRDGEWFGQSDNPKLNGQNCAACPFNQFGSASVGNGKACSEYVQALMFRPEDTLFPIVVRVPPSALKSWRAYGLGLIKMDPTLRLERVVTEISLEPVKDDVPKWHFKMVGRVPEEVRATIAARAKAFASVPAAAQPQASNEPPPADGDGPPF